MARELLSIGTDVEDIQDSHSAVRA